MDTITVDKNQLWEQLRINRDEHRAIFEKALDVYRQQMEHELEKRLDELRAGKKIDRYFSLPEPEEHTDDFDTAIQMLEWSQSDTVELTVSEFKMYVENEWGWQRSFASNTGSYLVQ